MARSAGLIISEGKVLLIERRRDSGTYYLFPGGQVESSETPEEALVREVKEELGLDVVAGHLVAAVHYQGNIQYYYVAASQQLADKQQLVGDEAKDAVWLPIRGLADFPVYPAAVALLVETSSNDWPEDVLQVIDPGR